MLEDNCWGWERKQQQLYNGFGHNVLSFICGSSAQRKAIEKYRDALILHTFRNNFDADSCIQNFNLSTSLFLPSTLYHYTFIIITATVLPLISWVQWQCRRDYCDGYIYHRAWRSTHRWCIYTSWSIKRLIKQF